MSYKGYTFPTWVTLWHWALAAPTGIEFGDMKPPNTCNDHDTIREHEHD